ncbi:methyl-accepting chemotaxis protein [Tepidimicrobium xylanilyticum]|uniref:Methyl-accepting chemotaxis sensory transducer with Cache sensor n=1 Tax=Tepidimicrobium xylanilyticum TaxID=1123352 RepID=A0A1H3ASM8_9FIRM|nr:methyl-accepting chemotaxis protein [Tepidimicrobium xylanilyticum]NLW41499.1 methyl-accepting chemotaxis protein [Tissierellia bacterium]GMG97649.1 methyl-accepting chemotaxis protein [Tepidimicrobium xylanilyticum]SDX32697.1 methyl-accepting chemotaxis sensory transducer with Cache sensor [Tepidimicrobium xylanilyticum]
MFKFKSIRTALLSIILPLAMLGMIAISIISYSYSKSIINNEIAEKMNFQMQYITENIEKRLLKHEQLASSLAKAIESSIATADETTYVSIIQKFVTTNEDTFGCGIWFEPYRFDPEQKYFGPYAYKDNGQVSLTMQYSNEEYDYFGYDWYINAKNTEEVSTWTDPYYDEGSDVTMISTCIPFFDSSGKVAGVVSADIDLNSIQNLINETKIGQSGWAFLLNEDGLYISHKDPDKIMKDNILNESNKSLAMNGRKILETQYGNLTYTDEEGEYILYYSQIPLTKWIIGLTISQNELYSRLNSLLKNTVLILLASLIVVSTGIVLYANNLTKKIVKLKNNAELLASGDLTINSYINSQDEIGVLSKSFNTMVENIKNLLTDTMKVSKQISTESDHLAATSEETAASSNEISKTIEEIARGAENQAHDTEEASIIVASLDKNFEKLKADSNSMYQDANKANDANKTGYLAVEDLINKTNLNNESMLKIENAIQELNTKSNNISVILETISSIAEQTNLLALNASIEAARAGDAGKGFSVVANEIRKLAEESKNAANKIEEIVEMLQIESNNTVNIMGEVITVSQEQANAVSNVKLAFDKIYESIENISTKIKSVSNSIDILNDDKNKIVMSIENIAAISQETAAASEQVTASMEQQSFASEEVAKSAEKLNELSIELNKQMHKFKV